MKNNKNMLRKGSSMLIVAVIVAIILVIAGLYFTNFGTRNPFAPVAYNPCAQGSTNKTATITITSSEMTPAAIIICPGQEISWINNDTVSHAFTVASKGSDSARLGDMDPIAPAETVSMTFSTPETIMYSTGDSKAFSGQIIVGK